MATFVSFLLLSLAAFLAIPVVLFFVEILMAITLPQWKLVPSPKSDIRQRIAVLVPAHNESIGLLQTLEDIKAQLRPDDRLLVVADNCTDDTAEIAKVAGAEVKERHDPDRIGKGYALDFGLEHLSINPPDIVIVIDADCRLADKALDHLANACALTGRPAQALYLMNAPNARIDYRVAEFAFRVKNWLRPLGLRALHLPCQLMGTGMAFPWDVLRSINLATGAAVEDLKLGLDLAQVGFPPLFCPSAGVNSQFPSSLKGAKSQRQRWEHGHLDMIARTVPRLILEALSRWNCGLLALTLDLSIPPVTLLGMLVCVMVVISAAGFLVGLSFSALIISATSLSAYIVAIILCWVKCGHDILPLSSVLSVAPYVVGKLPLYQQIFSRDNAPGWVRTDRGESKQDMQETKK